MSDYYLTDGGELYHHGVKGMRWGHRKKQYSEYNGISASKAKYNMQRAKQAKRTANKEYSKAFNKATSLVGAYGPNQNKNVNNMMKTAAKANQADKNYSQAKKAYKNAKKGEAYAAKAQAKMEKQKIKDIKKKYADQYLSEKSPAGRVVSRMLGTDKTYGELMYDMEKRSKVNKKWSS